MFEVRRLHLIKEKKAVSTLVLILLVLCAATIGSLVSYWWVMGNFYLEPENTTALTITEADFPVSHANYFTFTVVNPSHSISSTNITSIYYTVEGNNATYPVTLTSPEVLPIKIDKATTKTIKCFRNWGEFAGENITIHVQALYSSGATKTVTTEYVKMNLNVNFDPTTSCTQFSASVSNELNSKINLTLLQVIVNQLVLPKENLSITLPQNLTNNAVPVSFIGKYNWENLANPVVRVRTTEGYFAEVTANATASVLLSIDDVKFSETNSTEMSVTVSNSATSKTSVGINDIVLTYDNGTKHHIDGNKTTPQFISSYTLGTNKTVTFNHCKWDWTNYRNKNVTIAVYTRQNYTAVSRTIPNTPQPAIFNITPSFNLTDTSHFLVNVTNTPISLQNITITQIKVNTTQASFTPQAIPIGEWRQFNCSLDWASLRGKVVYVSVNASNVIVSQYLTLPSVSLNVFGYGNASDKTKFNITVISHSNSLNATLAKIVVVLANQTVFQSEGIGFLIQAGTNVTLTFSWNWSLSDLTQAKISVYTTQNLVFNGTFTIT